MPLVEYQPDKIGGKDYDENSTASTIDGATSNQRKEPDNSWVDDIAFAEAIYVGKKYVTQYKCRVCEKEFRHPSKVREHYRVHTGERPFKCAVCNKGFTQKGSLQAHIRAHTKERPFACRICEFQFTTSSQRNKHERCFHFDQLRTISELNDMEPPPVLTPESHPVEMVAEKDQNLDTEPLMRAQDLSLFDEQPGPSKITDRSHPLLHSESARMMVRADANDEEYQEVVLADALPPMIGKRRAEEECVKVLVDSKVFDMAAPRPKKVSAPKRPRARVDRIYAPGVREETIDIVVNAISRGLDPEDVLPSHRRPATIRICEYCGKKLKYPSRIAEHIRTHTKEKPHICPICNTGFATQTTLRMHLRRHMNNRPFMCPMDGCSSSFVNGGLLNLHIQEVHHQRRRFSCLNGCGKTLKSNSSRIRHQETECPLSSIPSQQQPCIDDGHYEELVNEEYVHASVSMDSPGYMLSGYEDAEYADYFYEDVCNVDAADVVYYEEEDIQEGEPVDDPPGTSHDYKMTPS